MATYRLPFVICLTLYERQASRSSFHEATKTQRRARVSLSRCKRTCEQVFPRKNARSPRRSRDSFECRIRASLEVLAYLERVIYHGRLAEELSRLSRHLRGILQAGKEMTHFEKDNLSLDCADTTSTLPRGVPISRETSRRPLNRSGDPGRVLVPVPLFQTIRVGSRVTQSSVISARTLSFSRAESFLCGHARARARASERFRSRHRSVAIFKQRH